MPVFRPGCECRDVPNIRGVELGDEVAWRALWSDYLAFYEAKLPPSVSDTTWRRIFDPSEPIQAIVAGLDGRLIGLAHVVLQRSTWSDAPAAYLHDLFVSPGHRRVGAGRALIEAATTCARSAGASRLIWLTQAENDVARSLYDRVGSATGFMQYAMGA